MGGVFRRVIGPCFLQGGADPRAGSVAGRDHGLRHADSRAAVSKRFLVARGGVYSGRQASAQASRMPRFVSAAGEPKAQ